MSQNPAPSFVASVDRRNLPPLMYAKIAVQSSIMAMSVVSNAAN
jgi:hypothetical protein